MNDRAPLKEKILKAIESGQLTMRPKWQFIVRTALIITGAVLLALVALFVASFVVFSLRSTGTWFAPSFGFRGVGIFFSSLPWVFIGLAVLFIILLEILIRRHSFAYGRPIMYSVLSLIIFIAAGSILIGHTRFHEQIFNRAEHGGLPFGGRWYRRFAPPPHNVTVGAITEMTTTGYRIENPRGDVFTVIVGPETVFPAGEGFSRGDVIVILGERKEGVIQAQAIQKPAFPPHTPHSDMFLAH